MSNPKEKRPLGALAYLPGLKAGVSRGEPDELDRATGAWQSVLDEAGKRVSESFLPIERVVAERPF